MQVQPVGTLQEIQGQNHSGVQPPEETKGPGKVMQQVWKPRNPKEPDLTNQNAMSITPGGADDELHQHLNQKPQQMIEGQKGGPTSVVRVY